MNNFTPFVRGLALSNRISLISHPFNSLIKIIMSKNRKIRRSDSVGFEVVFKIFNLLQFLGENLQELFFPFDADLKFPRSHLI
jgi:hypothetical protein